LPGELGTKANGPARLARRDAKSELAQVRAHHDSDHRRPDPRASTRHNVVRGPSTDRMSHKPHYGKSIAVVWRVDSHRQALRDARLSRSPVQKSRRQARPFTYPAEEARCASSTMSRGVAMAAATRAAICAPLCGMT